MGDFYEMFHDDAKTAARVLNLALTSREKGENATPMAGFPYHQLESYLGKLIAAGLRAAVCEQVEDPKLAKGLVRREVTRIVTPGTVTDDALLDPRTSNFLAAVAPGDPVGLAWVELSTGRFVAAGFSARQLPDQLARIAPAECLLSDEAAPLPGAARRADDGHPPPGLGLFAGHGPAGAWPSISARPGSRVLASPRAMATPRRFAPPGPCSIISPKRKKARSPTSIGCCRIAASGTLEIDEASRRSLEITRTIRDGRREGSLLWVLDRTVTAMGSRLLADWVANPLTDVAAIHARLDAVEELVGHPSLGDDLHEGLRRVYDVERLLARVTTGRASPRDLSFLGRTLRSLPALKAKLTERRSELLGTLGGGHRFVSRAAGDARSGVGRRVPVEQP